MGQKPVKWRKSVDIRAKSGEKSPIRRFKRPVPAGSIRQLEPKAPLCGAPQGAGSRKILNQNRFNLSFADQKPEEGYPVIQTAVAFSETYLKRRIIPPCMTATCRKKDLIPKAPIDTIKKRKWQKTKGYGNQPASTPKKV